MILNKNEDIKIFKLFKKCLEILDKRALSNEVSTCATSPTRPKSALLPSTKVVSRVACKVPPSRPDIPTAGTS